MLAAIVYGSVLAYAASLDVGVLALVLALGALGGLLLLAVLVLGAHDLLPWSLGLVGTAYVLGLVVHGGAVDDAAPLVGAGLLVVGELATWSVDERVPIPSEREVVVRRAAAVALLALAGLAMSALVVALAASSLGGGAGWAVVGAFAAVAAVAVPARTR